VRGLKPKRPIAQKTRLLMDQPLQAKQRLITAQPKLIATLQVQLERLEG
jgi:hypothetical protein